MQGKTQSSASIWTAFNNMTTAWVRRLAHVLRVAWTRVENSSAYAIVGTSVVNGLHLVQGNSNVLASLDVYNYYDETDRLVSMTYDRILQEPLGGISQAIMDIELDNTDNKFTPDQNATIGTALLPKRPVNAQVGFVVNSQEKTVSVFKGLTDQPKQYESRRVVKVHCYDLVNYLYNMPMDSALYEGLRSDEIIEDILSTLGFGSSQYVLDTGLNTIEYAWFEKTETAGERIKKVCEAEEAYFYADEEGILRFETRDHYAVSPHTASVWNIGAEDIISWEADYSTPIYNSVIVKAKPRLEQALADIWTNASEQEIPKNYNGSATNYYRFEGNSNATTGGVNGTDTDMAYGTSYGKRGQGALFNGSTSTIALDNAVGQVTTGDFTVGAWMKTSNQGANIDDIIAKRGATAGWDVGVQNGSIVLSLRDATGVTTYTFADSSSYTDGNWHHVVVSVDRDVSAKLYVDGAYVSSVDCTDRVLTITNTAVTHIGSYSTGIIYNWDGYLDEVVFFNSALSATQANDLYIGLAPVTIWASFSDPVTDVTTPASTTDYTAFTETGGGGSNITSDITITMTEFATSAKLEVSNANTSKAYMNLLKLRGTSVTVTGEFMATATDSTSIDKYDEQALVVENDFIESKTFAETMADNLVDKYSEPASKIILSVQGIPQLQLRDYVIVTDLDSNVHNFRVMRIQGSLLNGYFSQKLYLRKITANE